MPIVDTLVFLVGFEMCGIIALCCLIYFIFKKAAEDKELTIAEFKETMKSISDVHNELAENQKLLDASCIQNKQAIMGLESRANVARPTASFGAIGPRPPRS